MYIPEFWCGVILTLVVEFLIAFISSFFSHKESEDEK